MPRIVSCRTVLLARPHVVLTTSYGKEQQKKDHVLVIMEDESGIIGYGEATPLPMFTGETAQTVKAILDQVLLPRIIGYDSMDIAAIHVVMDRCIAACHAAKSAVDGAAYDLLAKELSLPLYALLGGKTRDRVTINRHIGITSREQAIMMAEDYAERGFFSIKLKVGDDVDIAADRVKAVREAAGDRVRIRVDANGGYTYSQAARFIQKTLDCDLEYYEQLLPGWEQEGMRQLRKQYGIPVLLDEPINSVREAIYFAASGAGDAVTIKLCKCGGLYPAQQIAAAVESMGMKTVVASTYDTHIGCSACLHLATALTNLSEGCDLTTFATQEKEAVTCHRLETMFLCAGSDPGVGVKSMYDFEMN